MPEIPVNDLDPRQQKQVENARKAMERNPGYAIDVLTTIVTRHPGCLEARKILRRAQQRAAAGAGSSGWFARLRVLGSRLKRRLGGGAIKDPQAALVEAERMLRANPSNPVAHDLLGRAAGQLGLLETAAFAYEELRRIEPENRANLKALIQTSIELGRNEEAVRLGDHARRVDPGDEEIPALIRKASVQQSIDKGRWEQEDGFRGKLRDGDEARGLEESSRAQAGEEGLRALVERARQRVEEEPGALDPYRELCSLHRKLGEFDIALEWLEKARGLEAGEADAELERLAARIRLDQARAVLADRRRELERDPADETLRAALAAAELAERDLRRELGADLVKRYPNEYGFRFDLGEVLLECGELDPAIRELQLAQRNPKVRLAAMILLGRAYMEKGFYDLAAEQFLVAREEIPGVEERKKEVLYQLGLCYERLGDHETAMAQFKALYGMDISFRDVAGKIDAFYSRKEGG